MTKHSECSHPATKSARAACRKQRASVAPSLFMIEEAYAANEMWALLNTAQEKLLSKYRVVHTTCEYCDQERPCFQFEHLGMNVCGPCERMYDVHEAEEKY